MRTTRYCKLGTESLETRTMLSATTVEVEPNDSSQTATIATFDPAVNAAHLVGSISSRNDRDFFAFTAPASGNVQLTLNNAPGLIGKVQVQGSQGGDLQIDGTKGITSGQFTVAVGQIYSLRIEGQNKSTGDYTIDLNLTAKTGPGSVATIDPTHPNEVEPNDRPDQANVLNLGADGLLTVQGVSTSDRDKDFFRFTPATSGNLSVTVRTNGGQAAQLEFSTQGTDVFETEPNDGLNSHSVAVVTGQTYLLSLRSPNSSPAAYLVDLALTQDVTLPTSMSATANIAQAAARTASTQEVKLETRLTPTDPASTATGNAEFEVRPDRTKLEVEVQNLGQVSSIQLRINGVLVGPTKSVNGGLAEIELDSRKGGSVPTLTAGALIEVLDATTGQVLLSGTLH